MSVEKLKDGFGDVANIPNAEKIIAAGAYDGLPKVTVARYLQHQAETQSVVQTDGAEPPQPQVAG